MTKSRRILPLALAAALLLLGAWCLTKAIPDGSFAPFSEATVPPAAQGDEPSRLHEMASTEERESPAERRAAAGDEAWLVPESAGPASEFSGLVLDDTRRPVADASVELQFDPRRTFETIIDATAGLSPRILARRKTDARGEFTFHVAADPSFDLCATAEGFAPTLARDVRAGKRVELVLARGAMLSGRVLRATNDSPVAGARIRVDHEGSTIFEGLTDAGGRYLAPGLTPGRLKLGVVPEIESPMTTEVELQPGQHFEMDVRVTDGIVVTGSVEDKTTYKPIANAEVFTGSITGKKTRTDASGRFVLSGIDKSESPMLTARAPGYGMEEQSLLVPTAGQYVVLFHLTSGRSVHGRIVDRSSHPIAGACVAAILLTPGNGFNAGVDVDGLQLSGISGRSDGTATYSAADGSFELPCLSRSAFHAFFVRKTGFGTKLTTIRRDDFAAASLDLGDIVLEEAARLSGFVTDKEGAPLAGVVVDLASSMPPLSSAASDWVGTPSVHQAIDIDPFGQPHTADVSHGGQLRRVRSTSTDVSGRFHFADLAAGNCTLELHRDGLQTTQHVVQVSEGHSTDDVHITMERDLSIEGRVIDAYGNSIAGAWVWNGCPQECHEARATSDKDGRFELAGLVEGHYTVNARLGSKYALGTESYELAPTSLSGVRAGAKNVLLQLSAALFIEGLVQSEDGSSLPHAGVIARRYDGTALDITYADDGGRFRLNVAAGEVVDLFGYRSKKLPDKPNGWSMIESKSERAFLSSVMAGTQGVVLRIRGGR